MPIHSSQCKESICEIVLTFDDGPNPDTTFKLLDFLKMNDIKVYFFVVGKKIMTGEGRSVIKRAHEEGHVIGNHTFSHPNLVNLTQPQIREEIFLSHELICNCTETCEYFRPPYGSSNKVVKQIIEELGYTQLFWNIDTMDWKYKDNGYWIDYGIKQLKQCKKNIILMHDVHPTTVDNIAYFIYRIISVRLTD